MYDSLLGKTIQYLDNINGNMINGTVVYMENIEINEEAVGSIGFFPKENIYRYNAEIGYWLAEPYWGQGIIPSVLETICEYIFETTKLTRIYAEVFGKNKASARALEKAGFTKEAIIVQNIYKNHEVDDTQIYSMRKSDFLNRL